MPAKRIAKQESRKLLVLRRNLWQIENPDGGFMAVRFCDDDRYRYASRRRIRRPASFRPLMIGSYSAVRFVESSLLQ